MTEVLFYHLRKRPIEQVLPGLLERSLERGWRVAVQVASAERLEALDSHLWTYREESFLPHGTDRESDAAIHPVVLMLGDANPNAADVRFLIDGAAIPAEADRYSRIVVLFDGEDPEALAVARERWAAAKASGFEVTYWQMDDHGRWQRQA
jgi:DNA polymerase III subunit chi